MSCVEPVPYANVGLCCLIFVTRRRKTGPNEVVVFGHVKFLLSLRTRNLRLLRNAILYRYFDSSCSYSGRGSNSLKTGLLSAFRKRRALSSQLFRVDQGRGSSSVMFLSFRWVLIGLSGIGLSLTRLHCVQSSRVVYARSTLIHANVYTRPR